MKRKLNLKNTFIIILFMTCLITFLFSCYKIINWVFDSKSINDQINAIREITNIKENEDSDDTEIIKQNEKSKTGPYWDYIKMNLIDVDFSDLKKTNKDTKGWIQVNGTNINYPFVQAKDNSYYLTRDFNKKYNDAGWVFLDYRNKLDGEDKNIILYAHSRKDRTMFGSLKNILKSQWLKNSDNYVIKLSTEYENTLWQIFSIYRIPTTNDYIQTVFNNNEFLTFTNLIKSRSQYNFKTDVDSNDRIITLSTCYNDTDKVVLHAKLIKKEIRQ